MSEVQKEKTPPVKKSKGIRISSKIRSQLMVAGLFLFGLLLFAFLTGYLSFRPVKGDILKEGANLSYTDDGSYLIKGDVSNVRNYLLMKNYTFSISEELLSKEYDVRLTLPVIANPIRKLSEGECASFKLQYNKILGFLYVYKGGEFISDCSSVPSGIDSIDLVQLQSDTMEMLDSWYREEPVGFPVSLQCEDGDCDGTYMDGPLSWYRYAQYANDRTNDSVSYDKYLSDLDEYTSEDFDWRYFQYGYIVNSDPEAKEMYGKTYTDYLVENTGEPIMNANPPDEFYYFYTTENQPSETVRTNFWNNYEDLNNNDLDLTAGRYAYNIMDMAYAYEIDPDPVYVKTINYYLWVAHEMLYFMDDLQSPEPTELKAASCNMMMADAKAFAVTGDEQYLEYLNYIVDKQYLDYLYTEVDPIDTEDYTYVPMTYLPCIEAFETLIALDYKDVEVYKNYQKMILNYVIENELIDLDTSSDTYGALLVTAESQDRVFVAKAMTSTCWFVKLLSEINGRGGL